MIIVNFTNDEKEKFVSGLDQYDYGQVLRIQGLNLPIAVEIHFGLDETGGTTVTRIGTTKDGVTDVTIPDSMLENNDTDMNYGIYAFVYLADSFSGKTTRRIKIQVKARSKPEAFDRQEDAELFRDAIKAVNESAARSAESEKQAEGWAHGREDLPERTQDNAKYYSDQAREDSAKTDTDRKEVERLVESVYGIGEQVAKVEGLTKQAQTSATNAACSDRAAKESENNAAQARAGAEVAENNAQLVAQKAERDKAIVEQAKNLVKQMGQEVLDNKNLVDKEVENFDLKAQQALTDVNNAGQAQTERVQTAGNATVESVKTAQGETTRAVETAKTEAIKAVQTEGTTQTGNVTAEGEKQVQAVQDATQEIMADREQIQENKTGIAKLKEDLAIIESEVFDISKNTLHSLLTETTPYGTYGNACANNYVWIPSTLYIPKGSTGKLKILSGNNGSSYKLFELKKNADSSYSIIKTNNHVVNATVNVDEYIINASENDIYLGFYSSDNAIFYSSSQTTDADILVRAALSDFSSGSANVTSVSSKLNFSFGLTVETKKQKIVKMYNCVVDANGNGDYLSIDEAINATRDGDTIFIKSGIYNEKIKMWGKKRHLIGESKHNTFIISTSRLYNNEPLQANMGTIENLTLIAGYGITPVDKDTSSTSYAIHVEYPNESDFELVIDNCNIISNVAPAIGLGVRYNQKVTIKKCYLETKAKEMYSSVYSNYFNCGAIVCHNDASGSNLGTGGYISIENCELKGVSTAITLQSQNNGNTLTHRFLKNILWSTENGTENAITLRTEATSGHLVGSDGVLDSISFGNNVNELNA